MWARFAATLRAIRVRASHVGAKNCAPTADAAIVLLFTFYFLLLTSYEHSYEQGYEQVMNIFVDNFFCGC
jgi:hypothetical protein